jgi:preprotein translocase subunit SecG
MYTFLVVVQVLVAVGLVALVMVQHGKGADAGAAFGSGASGTVFGARGSANFLTRSTAWLATIFFGVSLALAYLVNAKSAGGSVTDALTEAPAATAQPGLPAQAAPVPEAPVAQPTVPSAQPSESATPKLPE